MAFEKSVEAMAGVEGSRALAASRRIGVGFVLGGHGGKGHGAGIVGLEAYSHKND